MKTTKSKYYSYAINLIVWLIGFDLGTLLIDLIMGWSYFDLDDHGFMQILAGVVGSEVLLLLFRRADNKRRRKQLDAEYGKLFDEAGI